MSAKKEFHVQQYRTLDLDWTWVGVKSFTTVKAAITWAEKASRKLVKTSIPRDETTSFRVITVLAEIDALDSAV